MVISKWVITKCLNTEQKHLRATALYNDNVESKETLKNLSSTKYEQKRESVTLTLVLLVARYINQVSTRGSHCAGNQLLAQLDAHT